MYVYVTLPLTDLSFSGLVFVLLSNLIFVFGTNVVPPILTVHVLNVLLSPQIADVHGEDGLVEI